MDTDDLNNYRPWVPVGVYAYCNYDSTKNRTLRNGRVNDSIYVAGSYQLDNGIEIVADIQYWEEEADNVYFPYFVQQSYDAPIIVNDAGDVLNSVVDPRIFDSYGYAYGFLQVFP